MIVSRYSDNLHEGILELGLIITVQIIMLFISLMYCAFHSFHIEV